MANSGPLAAGLIEDNPSASSAGASSSQGTNRSKGGMRVTGLRASPVTAPALTVLLGEKLVDFGSRAIESFLRRRAALDRLLDGCKQLLDDLRSEERRVGKECRS